VHDIFKRVADKYDLMNDVMSGTLHRLWKDEMISRLGAIITPKMTSKPNSAQEEGDELRVLDVGGGTGDIAFRIIEKLRSSIDVPSKTPHITVCDINQHMLDVGLARAKKLGYRTLTSSSSTTSSSSSSSPRSTKDPFIEFVQGNAEELPVKSSSVDLVTIAFCIRNVTHVDKALEEAFRVLKPGGRFLCLEFSHVENPLFQAIYDTYSFNVIPMMGQVIANDRDSYQYLVESIRKFPTQTKFASMIRQAGFKYVSYSNFTGGICALHSGFKV
jgi:ubiquinone/menaquinone biosynthesis C-methylase UbiE